MSSSDDSPSKEFWPGRFQFSLRAQMIAVTIVAIVLGLIVIAGEIVAWVLFYGITYCLLPTPLVIGALFGRGRIRTFSIGALVPWVPAWSQSSPAYLVLQIPGRSGIQLFARMVGLPFFMVVAAAACGVLAVATRQWIERETRE